MVSDLSLRGQDLPHHVIKSTLITEKTTHAAERHNCYAFRVASTCSKPQIKNAIELTWGVKVVSIRTQTRSARRCRYKSIVGESKQVKIAIVTIHSDDRLSIF